MNGHFDDATIERAIATRRRRRRSASSPQEEPSARNAAILAILLVLLAVLVGLALISYTPADEANTDVSMRDFIRLLRNDDEIRAKFDTTHNWLGLVGAKVADLLLHDAFGYASFLLLLLLVWWARDLFRMGKIQQQTWHRSALILACIVACSWWFGSVRVLWSSIPLEWSGLVGEFLASVASAMIGALGSLILSFVSLFFGVVFATGVSVVGIVNTCRERLQRAIASVGRAREQKKQPTIRKPLDDEPLGNNPESDNPFPLIRRTIHAIERTERLNTEPRIVTQEETSPSKLRTERSTGGSSQQQSGIQPQSQGPHLTVVQSSSHTDQDENIVHERSLRDESILFTPPPLDLLVQGKEEHHINEQELKENARILQEKLETFKIKIENVTVIPGPVITQYEFVPAAGVKISQIEALADDIALALKARGIRIIAPIPGKGTVGVEIPNHKPTIVRFRSIVASRSFQEYRAALPIGLGKTITGEVYCTDLAELPHLLIAGATGSGKSVGINTIIMSLIWRLHPRDLKFVIIDPKKVELTFYTRLKHHYIATSPDVDEVVITSPANAVIVLKALVAEMEQRYDLLAKVGQRKISDYNRKLAEGTLRSGDGQQLSPMPYIVVVIDELADLMMTARSEVEDSIIRLAQLARAVGIHLVVATQRPSVDVITGLIKANFPARLAYQVASKVDSRTIIDTVGAEQLLGNGDMLFTPGGARPIRLQNAFITTEEVEAITEFIGKQRGYSTPYLLPSVANNAECNTRADSDFDPLFVEAARVIVHAQQGSTSLLQRRLRIGYSRAARIIDQLEAAGIVGPFDGSKARQVLVESDAELDMRLSELGLL
ncbi:MAG: DNA translocase FtsK [Bacteroidota bacterium]|nr:DNA translocase FtsK [Bacteroidota bacterium]